MYGALYRGPDVLKLPDAPNRVSGFVRFAASLLYEKIRKQAKTLLGSPVEPGFRPIHNLKDFT